MTRQLTAKEEKILKVFEGNNLKEINVSQVVLQGSGDFYSVFNPRIYEIKGTNTKLVFGDIRKSMGMEKIQKMIEQEMAKSRENPGQTVDSVGENNKENDEEICGEEISEVVEEIAGEGNDGEVVEIVEEIKNDDGVEKINDEDVKVLMEQTNVSYDKAVEVLKQENYDVIKALVELTKGNK